MNIRKSCSLALVIAMLLCIVIPSWGIAETTDETQPVKVEANAQNPSVSKDVNSVTVNNSNAAAKVSADGENTSAELTVTENVSDSDASGGGAKAVEVEAKNGGTAAVDVGGNLSASDSGSDNVYAIGVKVDTNGDSSTANVAIGGDITVSDESAGRTGTAGIYTRSNGTDTSTEISVGGDIASTAASTVNDTESYGILADSGSSKSATTKITVEGNVNGSSDGPGSASASATGIDSDTSYANNSKNEIIVGGSVTVSGTVSEPFHELNSKVYGINAESQSGSGNSTEISVGKNVTVINEFTGTDKQSGYPVSGINTFNTNGNTINVSVEGNVNVTSSGESNANVFGINVNGDGENTKTKIEVAGPVAVRSDKRATGVRATASNGSSADITVGDGVAVYAEGNDSHYAINTNLGNSQVDITVTGDVTLEGKTERTGQADGETSSFTPVNAAINVVSGSGGIVNISIADGNAVSKVENEVTVQKDGKTVDSYSETSGTGVYIMEDNRSVPTEGSEITFRVEELFENGNITGGNVGLKVILNENSETNVNVVATGTVTGDTAAVMVNKSVTEENLSLTVWQIVPTEIDNEKHVVAAAERGEEPQVTEKTKKIEENIRYIIKVEPNANATLTTGGTTEYDGYNVAYQGDRVTLKVNAADGYFIEGAYNGLGERIPLQYADGVYYIDVPMGGGIYLSARIGKHEDPAPEENASAPAVHVAPKGEGLTEIAKMDSVSAKIPAVNKYLKSEEREKMAELPPIQQLLVVLMKAGFGDAAAASGYTLTEEAKTLADSLNADLRGAVLMQYRWENGVRAKWYVIEMVLEGNQNVRVAFRQLEDGTWELKMI